MLGETSSPFCIPVFSQSYNVWVCQIWSKYTMRFKSYEHLHQQTTAGRNDAQQSLALQIRLSYMSVFRRFWHKYAEFEQTIETIEYHVVQEVWEFSLTVNGRTDGRTRTSIIVHTCGPCKNESHWVLIKIKHGCSEKMRWLEEARGP